MKSLETFKDQKIQWSDCEQSNIKAGCGGPGVDSMEEFIDLIN